MQEGSNHRKARVLRNTRKFLAGLDDIALAQLSIPDEVLAQLEELTKDKPKQRDDGLGINKKIRVSENNTNSFYYWYHKTLKPRYNFSSRDLANFFSHLFVKSKFGTQVKILIDQDAPWVIGAKLAEEVAEVSTKEMFGELSNKVQQRIQELESFKDLLAWATTWVQIHQVGLLVEFLDASEKKKINMSLEEIIKVWRLPHPPRHYRELIETYRLMKQYNSLIYTCTTPYLWKVHTKSLKQELLTKDEQDFWGIEPVLRSPFQNFFVEAFSRSQSMNQGQDSGKGRDGDQVQNQVRNQGQEQDEEMPFVRRNDGQ